MPLMPYLNTAMVLAGAIIMAAVLRTGLQTYRIVPREINPRWRLITILMAFFLAAYCSIIILQIMDIHQYREFVSSLVFLGGAFFVLVVIRLSRRTILQLLNGSRERDAINDDLVQKTAELEGQIAWQAETENKLREAKTTLENILNSSIPICITGTDFSIITANEAYYRIFNTPGDPGRTAPRCYDSRPGSACHTPSCPLNQVIDGREEVVAECTKIDDSGKVYHFIITARPFRDPAGETIGIVESFQDITLRKSAENQLALEKERLAITLQSICDGVITTDLRGRIHLLNRVAADLCGWPMDEAIGRPLEEVFHIVDFTTRKPVPTPVSKVIETGRAVTVTSGSVLVAGDGWERFITDSAAPILDQKGNIFGVVLVFRDISEKRKMESEIIKLEKLRSIGVLAGGIAHDFNNLLTAILGNITLARINSEKGLPVAAKLAETEKAIVDAKGLTQQLLTFSKGGDPIKKTVNPDTLLRASVPFALRGSNCLHQFCIEDDLWTVEADSNQLTQVMNNLVLNAVQSMPAGGRLTVKAANTIVADDDIPPLKAGRYVRISVCDTGHGIPAEHLPLIFDPYFTSRKNGSGLGLATVFSIIKRHGGHIEVYSEEDTGTTCTLHVPATERMTMEEEQTSREKIIPGSGRILVMDDEPVVREVAELMLAELGYQASCAGNGEQAVAAYTEAMQRQEPFACVVLDLTVPGGMGGLATIARLREIDPEVAAVLSSGYSNDPVIAEFREYGFRASVNKPYTLAELSSVLHEVIG